MPLSRKGAAQNWRWDGINPQVGMEQSSLTHFISSPCTERISSAGFWEISIAFFSPLQRIFTAAGYKCYRRNSQSNLQLSSHQTTPLSSLPNSTTEQLPLLLLQVFNQNYCLMMTLVLCIGQCGEHDGNALVMWSTPDSLRELSQSAFPRILRNAMSLRQGQLCSSLQSHAGWLLFIVIGTKIRIRFYNSLPFQSILKDLALATLAMGRRKVKTFLPWFLFAAILFNTLTPRVLILRLRGAEDACAFDMCDLHIGLMAVDLTSRSDISMQIW